MANSASLRHGLVELLFGEGVLTSPAVADAFLAVPRERFLPQVAMDAVYRNDAIVTRRDERGTPLSSSSQPSIMAAMLEALALEPGHRVLEVGTGTGYNAALLAELVGPAGRVTSVELDPDLATRATAALAEGSHRVHVVVGDGRDGWPAGAPFDRMIVTASAPGVPRTWFDQLADDGLVVMPLWLRQSLQTVVVLRRRPEGFVSVALIPGGFMRMRESLGEVEPGLQDQLRASEVASGSARPLVSLAGTALRHLDGHGRRCLLALALGPARTVPVARHAAGDDLLLFVSLAADEDHLIEWFGERAGEAGPGVVGAGGGSLAVLRRAPVVDHLDARGGTEAEDALLGLVERWEILGRPGRERLRVHVNYGAAPRAGRPASREGGAVSFDWA